MRQRLDVTGETARRPPRALCDGAKLAEIARVQRYDAIRLAEIHALEDDGFSAVRARYWHVVVIVGGPERSDCLLRSQQRQIGRVRLASTP